jgi:hypothetical protein
MDVSHEFDGIHDKSEESRAAITNKTKQFSKGSHLMEVFFAS